MDSVGAALKPGSLMAKRETLSEMREHVVHAKVGEEVRHRMVSWMGKQMDVGI